MEEMSKNNKPELQNTLFSKAAEMRKIKCIQFCCLVFYSLIMVS